VQAFCNDAESFFQSFEDDLTATLGKPETSEDFAADLDEELGVLEVLQEFFDSLKDALILE